MEIGITNYSKKEYKLVKKYAVDRDTHFPIRYDDWYRLNEQMISELKDDGHSIKKVPVRWDQLKLFLEDQGLDNRALNRARFVNTCYLYV